ncbi:hypothetical protein IEO21_00375 [Rhodonia placenta]|uniref:Uncharacterized protein n=1 Tax=Rhodonia placenta TaxID=104341 RepID=A0A8H7PBW1_9APHY|nr:hypothetical protein IEO21_00375 [Postia placenta]
MCMFPNLSSTRLSCVLSRNSKSAKAPCPSFSKLSGTTRKSSSLYETTKNCLLV